MTSQPLLLSFTMVALLAAAPSAQRQTRPPLTSADIDAVAQLVMLEDTRRFDEPALAQLIKAAHPEVRRRAAIAIGRIANKQGATLLAGARADTNADVAAAVVFATGQFKDAASIPWLAEQLTSPRSPVPVTRESAIALGKIREPAARAALASYLSTVKASPSASPAIGEALLSIGRFTTRGDDIAPIVRWATSPDVQVRWRATWALFRPRDPAAIPTLVKLCDDVSPDVRFWAVRSLTPSVVDLSELGRDKASARLRAALKDTDRRVRTEALPRWRSTMTTPRLRRS